MNVLLRVFRRLSYGSMCERTGSHVQAHRLQQHCGTHILEWPLRRQLLRHFGSSLVDNGGGNDAMRSPKTLSEYMK